MDNFYFYTETAFHHEGDLEYLKKLIIASKETGAGGIKFQVLTQTNDFISTKHSAFKNLSSWCFSYETWHEIFSFTKEQGLDIILMPLNSAALDLIPHFQIKFIEIHSVSFNDKQLHKKIKDTAIDLIIGMGGRTLEEVSEMQFYFGDQLKVLMTGFQSFPSNMEDIKLGRIADLKKRFPQYIIGYADHSAFDNEFAVISNDYAYLLGARIFEKHITVSEGVERVDYSAAVSPEKIKESIFRLQFLSKYVLLPDKEYQHFNEPELKYRNRQLICVAARNITKGEVIGEMDMKLKMIDVNGQTISKKEDAVGKSAAEDIAFDDPIFQNLLA